MYYSLSIAYILFFVCNVIAAAEQDSPVSPNIHVNQIGYLPSTPKVAKVSSSLGLPFSLINTETSQPVFKGMLKLSEANDQESGGHIWSADFSVVRTTGTFFLEVKGVGHSYPFRIDHEVYNKLSRDALKSFYYHRCGVDLSKDFAGNWAHPACHLSDGYIFSASAGNADSKDVMAATGGWHDGSDYGKYSVSGIFSSGLLLTLYELYPKYFDDGALAIPESGNGIPDLLDELRWEIEWLLRMQSEEGGVHHKLTYKEPGKPVLPNEEKDTRIIFPISNTATAGMSALTAKASRLYLPYDATFAEQCLQASEKAWDFLEEHSHDGGFKNPPGVGTKAYSDLDNSDERFWAAFELYRATGNKRMEDITLALAERRAPLLSSSAYWGNAAPLAIASILNATGLDIDSDLKDEAGNDLIVLADTLINKVKSDGYRLSIKAGEFTWGSNNLVLQNAVILLLTHQLHPQGGYHLIALDQLHYILGRNPLSMCYVTGHGSQSPEKPFHPFLIADKVKDPIPGLLVGGPNQFLNDGVLKRSFRDGMAPAFLYKDNEESFASNETTISWNAVLAFVTTWLNHIENP